MRLFLNILLLVFFLLCTSCQRSSNKNIVMTVKGPLPAKKMGSTLIHEHFLVDFIGAKETGYHRWERSEVVEKVLPLLLSAKEAGVKTIFETTPAYLGRDPLLLKQLSEKSGLHIVTNTGLYGAVEDKYIPEYAFSLSADSLASIWIREFEQGIEETGIRPGFIKIAVDKAEVLSEIDKKIVRAAIKTHRKTGLTIVSHTGPDGPAFAQLDILEQESLDPSAWVWTHAQGGSLDGIVRAAETGAWISVDNINKEELEENIKRIVHMKSAGFLNRLLISHDAGWFDPEEPDGDIYGYTDIFTHLLPALKKEGFLQAEINQLLVENPKEAYGL